MTHHGPSMRLAKGYCRWCERPLPWERSEITGNEGYLWCDCPGAVANKRNTMNEQLWKPKADPGHDGYWGPG